MNFEKSHGKASSLLRYLDLWNTKRFSQFDSLYGNILAIYGPDTLTMYHFDYLSIRIDCLICKLIDNSYKNLFCSVEDYHIRYCIHHTINYKTNCKHIF